MSARTVRFPIVLAGLATVAALAACREAEPPTHEQIVQAELAVILNLQGSPCGQVLRFTLDRRMDYRVECATGDVYRIHVSAEGNVNVKEHSEDR